MISQIFLGLSGEGCPTVTSLGVRSRSQAPAVDGGSFVQCSCNRWRSRRCLINCLACLPCAGSSCEDYPGLQLFPIPGRHNICSCAVFVSGQSEGLLADLSPRVCLDGVDASLVARISLRRCASSIAADATRFAAVWWTILECSAHSPSRRGCATCSPRKRGCAKPISEQPPPVT